MRRAVSYGLVALILAAAAARLLVGPQILPAGRVEWIDFDQIRRSSTGNDALACPASACAAADIESPLFAAMPDAVWTALNEVILAEPRWTTLLDDGTKLLAVQRSAIFGFPDIVQIEVRPETGGSASLLVFSRSVYGSSDFGVNRARVRRLLDLVASRVAAADQPG